MTKEINYEEEVNKEHEGLTQYANLIGAMPPTSTVFAEIVVIANQQDDTNN